MLPHSLSRTVDAKMSSWLPACTDQNSAARLQQQRSELLEPSKPTPGRITWVTGAPDIFTAKLGYPKCSKLGADLWE